MVAVRKLFSGGDDIMVRFVIEGGKKVEVGEDMESVETMGVIEDG